METISGGKLLQTAGAACEKARKLLMDKQNKRRVLRNFLGGRDNCVACPTMAVSSASNADRYSRICLLKYCYEMISYRNNRDSAIKCLGV